MVRSLHAAGRQRPVVQFVADEQLVTVMVRVLYAAGLAR